MHAVVCLNCGSKFAAWRKRCPRCRAHIIVADPVAEAARSRRLATGSAILVGAFVTAFVLLWLTAGPRPQTAVDRSPADPLAARRSPAAETPQPDRTAIDLERQRAFMEPADLATMSYGSGDYVAALAHLEAAIAKNPQDAESLSNLGQVLVKLGRTAEAVPFFDRACSLNPRRWAYRFNQARAFALLERWDESIAAYRNAQHLFPNDYVTTFNLALTLHKKGDEAAAVDEYKKAVELNPEEPSFRMALGISYEALQQNQDAAAAYSEYLRLAPAAADADKVRARIALLGGYPTSRTGSPAGL
jgi:tetratricopeptide (TPR) repeat protein